MKHALLTLSAFALVGAGYLIRGRVDSPGSRDTPPRFDAAEADRVIVLKADRNYTLAVRRVEESATNDDQNSKEWALILQPTEEAKRRGQKSVTLVCEER